MTAHDLTSIRGNLGKLSVHEDVPQTMEQRAKYRLVDTPNAVSSLIDTLSTVEAESASIFLDLEGLNLSRHGSISLVQIWVPTLEQAFLLDVHILGTEAFNTINREGKTIKSIFESDSIRKYLFDVRNDADALFALFDIRLAGVTDVQLLELATRRGPKHVLCGLAACIEKECIMPSPALLKWQSTKTEVVKMFDPRHGGSYDVFNARPLLQILIDYCVGDVEFLPVLSAIYEERLNSHWSEKVRVETAERLEQSRSPKYKPRGKHKMFGPRSWRFPPKSRAGQAAIVTVPTTQSFSQ